MALFKTVGNPNLNTGRILLKSNMQDLASPIPTKDIYVNILWYIFKSNCLLKSTFNPDQFNPYSDVITIYTEGKQDGVNKSFLPDGNGNWLDAVSFLPDNDFFIPINSLVNFSTPLSSVSFTGARIQNFISNRRAVLDKVLLVEDILSSQINTIGTLHNNGEDFTSVFIPDGSDKIIRNFNIQSNNRINYNLGYTPNIFTAIFDYKAGGGTGADGAYFYFLAKGGSYSDFPNGKYCNFYSDGYRIHFDEYGENEQLAVSWGGYENDEGGGCPTQELISSVGTVNNNNLGINFADNTWRTIKIHYYNGYFKIYINNVLKLQCLDYGVNLRNKTDHNFGLGGYVGGLNNYHSFKNFRFYKIIV